MSKVSFSEWKELQEAVEMLAEDREANLKRIKKAFEKHGLELLDGLSDEVLEDIVLKLTAKTPTQNEGDRLDEMIDFLFGDMSQVPPSLTKTGKTRMSKGEIVLDTTSEQYKNTILGRIGSKQRLDLLREALRSALKKSSASTASKIKYLYRLTQSSSLIPISTFMKPQIIGDMLGLIPNSLPKDVASDVYKKLAPLSPSGLGPVEIWLMLHVDKCTLEGGGEGAAGDINTLDGQNPIEIKGADGVMTFGNPQYRGVGWAQALEIANTELKLSKKLTAKDWTGFMSGKDAELRNKLSASKKGKEILQKMMRAYMDPGTFTDKDVTSYTNKFWNSGKFAGKEFEMFHLEMCAYAYWKYKDYKSGGNSFKAIMFIDKRSGKTAVISYSSSGKPKIPSGVSVGAINWINGYTNYADGASTIKY